MLTTKFQSESSTNTACDTFFQCTAGTSGAVPAAFTRARDIVSVVKGTNTYVFTFDKGATALLDWNIKVIQATYNASTGACKADVVVDDIAGTTKAITVKFYNAAGTAVDLAAGDVLRARFTLKRTPGLA